MQIRAWEDFHLLLTVQLPAFYLKALAESWGVEIKAIAEIGVFRGKTSKMLRTLFPEAKLYLVDPWELYEEYRQEAAGPISHKAGDYERAFAQVQRHFGADGKVEILRKTSVEAAPVVPDGLDLVFIDGNHSYEYVRRDIDLWYPKVRTGGMISGHDYDPVVFPQVVRAVNGYFGMENIIVGSSNTWLHRKFET